MSTIQGTLPEILADLEAMNVPDEAALLKVRLLKAQLEVAGLFLEVLENIANSLHSIDNSIYKV